MKKKSVLSEGLPVYSLPSFDIEKYKQKMLNSNHKKLKFARMFDLSVDIRKQAKKITEENGTLYVLSIRSKKAFSLSPVFGTYELPDKAQLFIYNPEFSHVKGAFTSENNKVTEKLPVGPVRGEEIIIEYYEPHNRPFDGKLKLAKVGHDFVDIYGYLEQKSSGVGASEDCNVNINCEAGEEFQDIKQAVCRVIYNGWLCSGSLINNTNFDGSPYFLTANHCISSESEAQDAVFYFNFESPECDTSYIDDYQTISVSDLVATAPDSKLDFSLLEISESIPINYKPYYAGWNLDTANIENTTTIHHPSGDVKKITKDDDAPVSANYGSTYDEYSHWLIEDWELGTTEGGSSGAPLFDQQKRIIGD
ncbi:MAG: trypsin-like serine peptidase, partial [Bacteroidota bacterium]